MTPEQTIKVFDKLKEAEARATHFRHAAMYAANELASVYHDKFDGDRNESNTRWFILAMDKLMEFLEEKVIMTDKNCSTQNMEQTLQKLRIIVKPEETIKGMNEALSKALAESYTQKHEN